ncbi:MAG: hypothetical protein ACK5F0_12645 [Flavobacteriales bacterium]|jgi:hypothetical protein
MNKISLSFLLFLPLSIFSQGKVVEAKDSKNAPDDPRAILVYEMQLEDLKKSVVSFQSGSTGLYKNTFSSEWAYRIISDTVRAKFFEKVGSNISQSNKNVLNAKMDEIKPMLSLKIPNFKPAVSDFSAKDPSSEGLMKASLLPHIEPRKSGLTFSDWKLVKNPSGLVDYRYKDGTLLIRNTMADYSFCEVMYFRISQSFDGVSFEPSVLSSPTSYLCGCD